MRGEIDESGFEANAHRREDAGDSDETSVTAMRINGGLNMVACSIDEGAENEFGYNRKAYHGEALVAKPGKA